MRRKKNLNIEQQAKHLIVENFDDFVSLIENFPEFTEELISQKAAIYKRRNIALIDILHLLVIEKLMTAVPMLDNLKLLGEELPLLRTPNGRGKQPSVDIMAYDPISGSFALLELKISNSAEREAVTELGAYSQGLQNRYNGLSNLQMLWLPVSTDWRTTTKSSIAYFLAWQKKLALPLHMHLDMDSANGKLKNLRLELFNPINEISDTESRCLFSYECFDAFDYCTMNEIKNRPAFINYVISVCNSYNINGFIIFHKPVKLMYPYGFTLCIFNPYHGNIHKHMSNYILSEYGSKQYKSALRQSRIVDTNYWDVDLKTDQLKFWEMDADSQKDEKIPGFTFWDNQDFVAVSEMADPEGEINAHFLVTRLMEAIDGFEENPRAFGTPNFMGTINGLQDSEVDAISYFGLHHELVSRHVMIEQSQKRLKSDFFNALSSFTYLKTLLNKFNH